MADSPGPVRLATGEVRPEPSEGLRGNPRFLRLFAAGLVSLAGGSIGQVAVAYDVYGTTHSAVDVALVGIASTVPLVLFSLVGGTLADRYGRRRLMVLSDLGRSVAFGLLAILLLLRGFDLAAVLAVTAVASSFFAVFNPAQQSLLPTLVPPDSISAANATIQSTSSIVGFLAFGIAGALIVATGAPLAIGLNALTFVGSAVLLSGIPSPPVPPRAGGATGFWKDTQEGFRYLRSQLGLLGITLTAMFSNFFVGLALSFVVVYAAVMISGSAFAFGLLLAAFSAGTAVGAPLLHRWRVAVLPRTGIFWGLHMVLFGGALGAMVLVPTLPVAAVALFALGWLVGFAGTMWLSAVQITVPSEMQGRYFGVDALGSFAILPLSQVVGGITITLFGIGTTYLIAAVGVTVVGALGLGSRPLREYGTPRLRSVHRAGG